MKLPKFTKPYRLRDYNFTLVTLVFILSVIGILVVGSAKQVYQSRQVLGVVIGIVFMMIVTFIDYVWLLLIFTGFSMAFLFLYWGWYLLQVKRSAERLDGSIWDLLPSSHLRWQRSC